MSIYTNEQEEQLTLHQLFIEQVQLTPNHVAVKYHDQSITYAELDIRSDLLAEQLRKYGVGRDVIVGLFTYRSIEMIVGMLAILKAEGAYLPLDPDYPNNRITYLIENSKVKVILSQDEFREKSKINNGVEVIYFSDIEDHIEKRKINNSRSISCKEQLAYVIYTSGSTGNPKGVMIEHQSIVNTILWRKEYYSMSSNDVILQLPSMSFDSSVEDIFTPLLSGSTLVLIDQKQRTNIKHLQELVKNNNVTHFMTVPSFYKVLLSDNFEYLSNMRFVTIAGEDFTLQLVQEHYSKLPSVMLFNEYGPAENSVCSTVYYFDPRRLSKISIGKPIKNHKVYLLDEDMKQIAKGEVGEIYLSGKGLARGYLDNVELTVERFKAHPFELNEKIYRTGDMARQLPDGNFEYLGRADNQVKIRGFRVELKEIEYQIIKTGLVDDAYVTSRKDALGNKQLFAYIIADTSKNEDIISVLKTEMPDYMIPYQIINMNSFPLTPNGKIDDNQLPAFVLQEENNSLDSNEVTIQLNKIIREVVSPTFSLDGNTIDQDIKNIGIDSISFITLLVRIESEFDFEFDYDDLISSSNITIRDLLALIDSYKTRNKEESY